MKWVSVKTGYSGEGYELWAEDKKLAGISFSNRSTSARLESNTGKRLFFFEKKGILAQRTVIKNEYGIKMGEVEDRIGSRMTHLEMDDKNYYYTFNDNNSGELKVFDEESGNSLLTCSFDTLAPEATKSLLHAKFSSLLLALCWYAFQPQHANRQMAV